MWGKSIVEIYLDWEIMIRIIFVLWVKFRINILLDIIKRKWLRRLDYNIIKDIFFNRWIIIDIEFKKKEKNFINMLNELKKVIWDLKKNLIEII